MTGCGGPFATRWGALLLFGAATLLNQAHWGTFAPIAAIVATYLGVEVTQVDYLSLVYMILYVPLFLISCYVIDRRGLRFSVVSGAVLNAVGSILRTIGGFTASFGLVMAGQLFAATAQLLLFFVPSRIALAWFPATERATATGIAWMLTNLGMAMGFIVSSTSVPSAEMAAATLPGMLLAWALVSTLVALLAVGLFRQAPEQPPSLAAAASAAMSGMGGGRMIRTRTSRSDSTTKFVATGRDSDDEFGAVPVGMDGGVPGQEGRSGNGGEGGAVSSSSSSSSSSNSRSGSNGYSSSSHRRDFGGDGGGGGGGGPGGSHRSLIAYLRVAGGCIASPGMPALALGYGMVVGQFYAVSTTVEHIFGGMAPSTEAIGWLAFVMMASGTASAALVGPCLDRTRRYRATAVAFAGANAAATLGLAVSCSLGDFWTSFVLCCLYGITTMALLTICTEWACELTFPAPAELSSAVLMASAQIFGTVFTLVMDGLRGVSSPEQSPMQLSMWLLIGLSAVAAILLALTRGTLRRIAFEAGSAGTGGGMRGGGSSSSSGGGGNGGGNGGRGGSGSLDEGDSVQLTRADQLRSTASDDDLDEC